MKKRFHVKKRTLLLIAGIVWLIAGFNVARLGILSYRVIDRKWYLYLFSVVAFFYSGLGCALALAGVSRQTISLIERGDYSPSVTLALKIARIFQVSVEDIFMYEEDEDETGE